MERSYNSVVPKIFSLEKLKEITNNFSKEQELGSGTFGIVYKGVQNGEEIAVKMLQIVPGHKNIEQSFVSEFQNLVRLTHPNIVKLLGYCYEIKHEFVDFGGRLVPAANIYRALCFEYMHEGSLQNHLYEEHDGHDWQTRYKIIKGVCEGLKYLHEVLENPVYHLDLKPDNILLDKNMVPKLADFGLSKLVRNESTMATESSLGTIGYMPPEYIEHNLVSNKFDIFSLGVVMIRIISGYDGYKKSAEVPSAEFVYHVYENWKNRLHAELDGTSLNAECIQVKRCIDIALDCVKRNREERPTIGKIIQMLNETESIVETMAVSSRRELANDHGSKCKKASGSISESTNAEMLWPASRAPHRQVNKMNSAPVGTLEPNNKASTSSVSKLEDEMQSMAISAEPSPLQGITGIPMGSGEARMEIYSLGSSETSELLDVYPLQLCFPLQPTNNMHKCPVTLTNRTDCYVGVIIKPAGKDTPFDLCFTGAWDGDTEKDSRSNNLNHMEKNKCEEEDVHPATTSSPFFYILEPHSTFATITSIKEQQNLAERDTCVFEVVMVVMKSEKRIRTFRESIGSKLNMDKHFWKTVAILEGGVQRAILTAVMCDPASCKDNNSEIQPKDLLKHTNAICFDWHPTEDMILTAGQDNLVSIFDYSTEKRVFALQVPHKRSSILRFSINTTCSISSAKFFAEGFAAGDKNGCVHVYTYTTAKKVAEFDAHPGKPVSSLAVHPAQRYLLTASSDDSWIKLWNWSPKGWKCNRTFNMGSLEVFDLMWNPNQDDSFSNVINCANTQFSCVQVWNIHSNSDDPTTIIMQKSTRARYIYTDSDGQYMISHNMVTNDGASIWDMEKREPVHKLIGVGNQNIDIFACDPTFPIFVTASCVRGTLCFWDARTYRVLKIIHVTDVVKDIVFVRAKNSNSRRLCIRCRDNGIQTVDISE